MQNLKFISTLTALVLIVPLSSYGLEVKIGATAEAQTNAASITATTSASAQLANQNKIDTAKAHAKQEVDRRVQALQELTAKIEAMIHVSSAVKTQIASNVSTELSNLGALQIKIAADTDSDTLKSDIRSISQSYRIFMLVMPQARIESTADRVHLTTALMSSLLTKLTARVHDAQLKGSDTVALSTALADMSTKNADAAIQADAAVLLIANLYPDNGDTAIQKANNDSLKAARAKLKIALDDLNTARNTASTIFKGLGDLHAAAAATTTVQAQ